METKIKNTLFRFVSFRKPEQIEDDKKKNLFVHHPNPQLSELYAATQAEFDTKIINFENSTEPKLLKTVAELKEINKPLYDLAFWVLRNRESVTADSFQNRMDELDLTPLNILSDADESMVWDNFIYQVCTHKDETAREVAMTLLYGNYLLKQQTLQNALLANSSTSSFTGTTPVPPNPDSLTVKQFRRILQARIVRPDFLAFPPVTTSAGNSATAPQPLSLQTQEQFRLSLQQLRSESAVENLEMLRKELKSVTKKYNKLEAQNLKSYEAAYKVEYDAYLADVNSNSSSNLTGGDGNTSDGDDENSGSSGIPVPVYDYTPLAQLDTDRLQSHLSEASFEFYNKIANEDIENLAELDELINQKIKEETEVLYSNKKFSTSYRTIGGVLIPNEITNPTDNLSFALEPIKDRNKWTFNIAMKFPDKIVKIQSIDYKLSGATLLGHSINANLSDNVDGIIKGKLFAPNGITVPALLDEATLEATIKTTAGVIYFINQPFEVLENKTIFGKIVSSNEEGQQSNPTIPPTASTPTDNTPNWKKFGVTRLGIADYRKVEQSICCYVPGEVSHIENVMAREYKERSTKRLRRSENTTTTESSTETENLTDSTSTERNEMHQEISKMQQQSMDLSVSAGVGYSGGGWNFNVNNSFAYHNSKEESNNMARTEAKEVTERAMERVVTKKREERISKIIDEFTEENKHGYDNREGDKHISGVYRWVDKIYKNEIFNYGKRLMYEFMIPEPAKFHWIFSSGDDSKFDMEKPLDPRKNGLDNFHLLGTENYATFASAFGADIEGPPAFTMVVGKSYSGEAVNGKGHNNWNDLKIPEGYKLEKVNCTFNFKKHSNNNIRASVSIGDQIQHFMPSNTNESTTGFNSYPSKFELGAIGHTTDTIPVSIVTWDVGAYMLTINAIFKNTDEFWKKWQIETFNKIIQAYEDKLATYEQKLAAFNAEVKQSRATNPLFYREIENMVLRKNCISYLLGFNQLGRNFQLEKELHKHAISHVAVDADGNRLSDAQGGISLPDYASKVKFIEQAFEWEIMSYLFYPYYWAFRDNWTKLYGQETDDVLFTKFIQSGMARVILTVRPGFEDAVNWFLETGQIWNGAYSAPVIGDDLYLSIVDELQEQEYYVEGSWESRIPSTLTAIQDSGVSLHAEGLPCACTQESTGSFGANGAMLNNAEGVGNWIVSGEANPTPPIYVPPTAPAS